jgi:site-specific recombinase XerD
MRSIRKARAILEEGLLGDFARGLEEHDLSPVTARGYRHDLDRFREWIEQSQGTVGSAIALARITAVDLINYRQHLVRVERLQATTINRKVQALKKLFRWARECGQVKTDVSVDLRFLPLGPRLRPPGLTAPEVQALLRAAGETRHGLAKRNYALVTLLVETGLRVGEVCQLRRGDLEVHDRSGRVRVRAGKGRKAREVPLNSNARRALRLNLADRPEPHPEDPVFLSERGGKPLALRTVQATIAELGQRAHIRRLPVTPHLMRHTFALRYLKHNPGELLELANAAGPRVLGHHRSLCTAHRRAVGRRRGEESTLMPAAASPRQVRRSGVILPEDPSDEELARNWTLSESDQREVLLCRGEENRRRFALQLCVLRWYGRLLEPEETAPVRVANYMGAQLALPPVLFVGGVRRAATETEYAERIRRHLGYVRFHPDLQRELANWVAERTLEGMSVEEVTQQAERWLRARCVVLPRAVVFARLLATQCRRAQRGLYAVLAQQVPAALLPEMDALLEVPESSNRSHLFRLKEYPPEGKPDTIAVFLENYTWLKQIGTAEIRFRGCHPALIRQFAWAVRRNDVWHLREYPDEKRHALLACFLVEALKTILDHSIEMNDQYLIGMCRRSEHAFESDLIEARKRARRGNEQVLAAMEILLDSSGPGPRHCIGYSKRFRRRTSSRPSPIAAP